MKIAIYGGSFDPFHNGHKAVIDQALQTLLIDKLLVVPAYLNPFKQSSLASPQERLRILQTINFNPKVEIYPYEIEQNRPTPTIQTVEKIITQYGPQKLYVVIGADNLPTLSQWRDYDKLSQLVEFVVATRDNITIPQGYKILEVHEDISSTALRSKEVQSLEPK